MIQEITETKKNLLSVLHDVAYFATPLDGFLNKHYDRFNYYA